MAVDQQLFDRGPIELTTLGLEIRPLVPVQPEPPHGPFDALDVLVTVAIGISVLYTEKNDAAVLTGVQPVEQRRAAAPDMEVSCRRGGEAHSWPGHGVEASGVEPRTFRNISAFMPT